MRESREMSFFSGPITNKRPNGKMILSAYYELIKSKKYKWPTILVRKDKSQKNFVLAYFTPCGVFYYCKDRGILIYSGYLNFDFDDLFNKYGISPEAFKQLLAADTFLNFNLLNISVSGTGVKGILWIKDARLEEHETCYSIIEKYILDTYGIKADPTCRNLSRPYYLSYDPDAYYNPTGFIDREVLLNLFPAPEPPISTSPNQHISTSTSVPSFSDPDYSNTEKPSDLLNSMEAIWRRALNDLVVIEKCTLHADGIHLTREGKCGGTSMKFNFYPPYGFPVLTNFSTNTKSFGLRGFSPVQIICRLEFNNDWNRCITQLAHEYLR